MGLKAKFFEIAVAGIVAGGFSGGLVALLRLGFPADATLGFFGGIIGAAATVLGAVWIQDARNARARAEEYGLLARSIGSVEQRFAELVDCLNDLNSRPETIARACEACNHVYAASKETIEDVLRTTTLMDHTTRMLIREMVFALNAFPMVLADLKREGPDSTPFDRPIVLNLAKAMRLTLERTILRLEGRL